MTQDKKVSSYSDPMRVAADSAAGFTQQIFNAMPDDADHAEKKKADEMVGSGHDVQVVVQSRQRAAPATVRAVLIKVNSAWTGAIEICSGKARTPAEISDVGPKAQDLLDRFFVDGVPTTQSTALEAWTASTSTLERLDDEGLMRTFELLVGKEVVAHIRAATSELGEEIGTGDKKIEIPSPTALGDALARCGMKIAQYCRLLAAKVDEEDAASVKRFFDAVAPIDAYRASARGGGASTDGTDNPTPVATNGTATPKEVAPTDNTHA